jgi:hypothetical protein
MPGSFTSDGLREMTDSIEKKEILLSALVMLKELLQRGLRTIAFDGDSGNSAGVIDRPHFSFCGGADCTKIHSGRRS